MTDGRPDVDAALADRGGFRAFVEVAGSGVASVRRHPLRHVATALAVIAMLLPYVVGTGVARGLLDQARTSVAQGADLYVHADRMGLPAPLPRSVRDAVVAVPGVRAATPRIVVPTTLGKRDEPVVLVGISGTAAGPAEDVVRGRLPEAENEVAVGSVLARELGLDVGSRIPPFYRSAAGERVSTVVGVFREDAPPWQARVVLTTFATAERIVDRRGGATDLLVTCEEGEAATVARAVRRLEPDAGGLRLHVTTREDLDLSATRGLLHVEGVHHALFALVFATGIPILLVTSGTGLRDRRAETGLLRATGWRVDEVLLRAAAENLTVATVAAATAIVLAWAWLELLGGWGVAPVFLRGAAPAPGFVVPFRLTPTPVLLGVALAYGLVLAGSVSATWRAASVPPARAME